MKRLIATTAGLMLAGSALATGPLDHHDNYGSILIEHSWSEPMTGQAPGFGAGTGGMSGSMERDTMRDTWKSKGEDAYGNILFDLERDTRHFEY